MTPSQQSPLHRAAACGDVSKVRQLLDGGKVERILEQQNDQLRTPLHEGVLNGQLKVVELLLERGASAKATCEPPHHWTALHLAVFRCKSDSGTRIQIIEQLLDTGNASLEEQDACPRQGLTPLLLALFWGKTDMARYLLNARGANWETAHGRLGQTALHIAAASGRVESVTLLLQPPRPQNDDSDATQEKRKRLALLEAVDQKGQTPLHHAVDQPDNEDVVQFLLDHQAPLEAVDNAGKRALHIAVEQRDVELVKLLLARGANANEPIQNDGKTPLHCAIKRSKYVCVTDGEKESSDDDDDDDGENEEECISIIQCLLENGAKLEVVDKQKKSPFLFAVSCGRLSLAKVLLELGANVNAADECGQTALHHAAKDVVGGWDKMKLLFDQDRVVCDATDTKGKTPLHHAVCGSSIQKPKLLIDRGANVNAQDVEQKTPLFHAILKFQIETVELLIERGANVDHLDADHKSPMHLAAETQCIFTKKLMDSGANIHLRDKRGKTPLHYAAIKSCHKSSKDTAELLLNNGVDCDTRDAQKLTPLYYAAADGKHNVVRLLLENGGASSCCSENSCVVETPSKRLKSGHRRH